MRDRLPGIAIILTMIVFHVTTILWLSGWWRQIGFAPLASIPVDLLFGWAGSFAVVPATITALLVLDFFGYWYHRIQHSWLWPFHAVHHSVEELHAANNYVHAFEEVLRFAFVSIPLSFLPVAGPVSGKAIIVYLGISQYLIHSPLKLHLGPLRYFVTDNRYHRIHHSTDPAHFNRNYGTTFTVWDQLFGTAYFPKRDEWPDTGLEEIRQPANLLEWLDFPLRFLSGQRSARPEQLPETTAPAIVPASAMSALGNGDG